LLESVISGCLKPIRLAQLLAGDSLARRGHRLGEVRAARTLAEKTRFCI
jgi:hypothetical protein